MIKKQSIITKYSLILLLFLAGCSSPPDDLLEVYVKSILLDPVTASPVLMLADPDSGDEMPIWIGLNEARAINAELEQTAPPCPMPHDLIKTLIESTSSTLDRVIISDLKENTFYAALCLRSAKGNIKVDCRPSDAVAIALRCKAPIYLSANLINKRVLQAPQASAVNMTAEEKLGFFTQELTPALQDYFKAKSKYGVLVSEIRAESPASGSGLQSGDILTSVAGVKIKNKMDIETVLNKNLTAKMIRLTVHRKGKSVTLKLRIYE